MNEEQVEEYHVFLDESYPMPRSAMRFIDAMYSVGRVDPDVYLDLLKLYSRPLTEDILLVLFEPRQKIKELYKFVMSVPDPPKDINGFIEDCVRQNAHIQWSEDVFVDYFIKL